MQDEFLRLQSVLQKTIVFITHDFDEAIRLADRIAIMKDGRIVQIGTPEELVLQPGRRLRRGVHPRRAAGEGPERARRSCGRRTAAPSPAAIEPARKVVDFAAEVEARRPALRGGRGPARPSASSTAPEVLDVLLGRGTAR